MQALVPKERAEGETRVAATPETVAKLSEKGLAVAVERGAGAGAFISDEAYADAGARLVDDVRSALPETDLLLKVRVPLPEELAGLREGAVVCGFLAPHKNLDVVRTLRDRKITAIAMELVPRITRAQKMDALSSQASIGGYKAVLVAANHLPKYFPLLMTAAGTVKPARVVIMGAGVAGLQAIATARRLGAVVEVSDIRAEVKEQVESLGAKFIDLPEMQESSAETGGYAKEITPEFLAKQQAIVAEHVRHADVVITTALVPGRPAPKLLTRAMVESMRPGSVIVDMAVEAGGNCEVSEYGKTIVHEGVTIVGHPNLPATLPADASMLYARNVQELVFELLDEGQLRIDLENDILTAAVLTHQGEVRHGPTREALES
ncbi:MAG: Re/Si-specific NAD(P)(+) transhydrogenase subunit alpha [Deltaproteobacteria bacterium]|nr:MAG: Re/Si-specific NAD(P)(+) transhydrogenase subunit alpha [Deltaproteobacteria bacterium]